MKRLALLLPLVALAAFGRTAPQPPPADPAGIEFFEKKVRPLLAERCVGCHSGAGAQANLRLDQPSAIRKGGPRGPLLVPGDPDKSRLIQAVRYTDNTLMMPPSNRLPAEAIATLEEWVRRGAPMPADTLPPRLPRGSEPQVTGGVQTPHWAYLPVKRSAPPALQPGENPIDAFVRAKRAAAGLSAAPPADRRTLIRRVTFDLIGLPPTPEEVDAFVADTRPDAYERVVDRLLASPHYGERWARHWLDLVRYGDTMGHEFDYEIQGAWRYRDYVIRALNADVPYDQFVREHLAGDLLPQPRRDPASGRNESVQGTGFFWLGEGKHGPVDVRQEQADRFDNQIDVLGKALLAQTVACARCHNHKFDPIPQTDYYALYGVLKSSRYDQATVNDRELAPRAAEGDALRESTPRAELVAAWRAELKALPDGALADAARRAPLPGGPAIQPQSWRASGFALAGDARAGDPLLTSDTARPLAGLLIRPAADGRRRANRLEGALRSPSFVIDKPFLHVRAAGRKSHVRLILENFVVMRGPRYDGCERAIEGDTTRWHTFDTSEWRGLRAYVELMDGPMPSLSTEPSVSLETTYDAWAALDSLDLSESATPPVDLPNPLAARPNTLRAALEATLSRWAERAPLGEADTPALALLDRLIEDGKLSVAPLAPLAARRNLLEARIPAPVRALAMCDGPGEDERVFVRGNHRALAAVAPRRGFTLCFRNAPAAPGSGRLELAQALTAPTHPLTARVIVNRLWHHHFGVGIVPSVDDFGKMGEKPTHPELLDWLASELIRDGWSLKKLHRLMVTSATYRQSSVAARPADDLKDPKDALLHRMRVRRLEAEAIRDSLLAVSGSLKPELYGPGVLAYIPDQAQGRGRPPQGPLDGDGRRSLYIAVRRNFPSPFFQAFDQPTPFTTIGRRTVSNVPAQALSLMNGPLVRELARRWAERVRQRPSAERIDLLYRTAFGRPPTDAERAAARAFVADDTPEAWTDLCHILFNVKEFVFIG